MDFHTSPIPVRQTARVVRASPQPSLPSRADFPSDDEDELAVDIIPQSPYFTQPTQIITQPTQIVSRTSWFPPRAPTVDSSPQSIIEVPASSPTLPRRVPFTSGRLASLMAPAGTIYRAPMASISHPDQVRKRQYADISSDGQSKAAIIIEDSSSDERPTRGDIRPSAFKRNEPQPEPREELVSKVSHNKALNAKRLGHLAAKTRSSMLKRGHSVSLDACKEALEISMYNTEDAMRYLLDASPKKPPSKEAAARSFIRSFTHTSAGSSSHQTQEEPETPPPQPKKRKLVRGVRNPAPLSSQSMPPVESPSPVKPQNVLSLISDDESEGDEAEGEDSDGDGYSQAGSGSEDESDSGVEKRALQYLNSCSIDDLVAVLGGGRAKDKAESLISHRPFRNVAAITRITKTARGKNARPNIGQDIFDAVRKYIKALDAIDQIVAKCDKEGSRIKSAVGTWNVNTKGEKVTEPVDNEGHLMTPSSNDDKTLVELPIPKEPKYMRGHCTMKTYQLYGLNWLWQLYRLRFGCILADDMGLGKTCQVVAFLSHLAKSYDEAYSAARPWPNLVVVPPTTLGNWQAEFKKFAPKLRVTAYDGSQKERDELSMKIQRHPERHHVILASYSKLSDHQDLEAMKKIAPNVAIFDEGHKLKNSATNVYKNLNRIPTQWRVILSGTPVQNNLMEMINLLNFIQPALFRKHIVALEDLFTQKVTLQDVSNGAILVSDRVRRARSILEPFILQRRKEQVLQDLPKKTSRVLVCDLEASQRPIYESYERRFRREKVTEEPRASQSANRMVDDQNNVWIQLRKAAIHPQLFRRHFDNNMVEEMAALLMEHEGAASLRQPNLKHLTNELKDLNDMELHLWCQDYPCIKKFDVPNRAVFKSGKVEAFLKLVKEFQEKGDRVLVFSKFAKVVNILREVLADAEIRYLSLEGQTKVSERQALLDQFNGNPDIPVFLITTGSGGTGINLTAANKVIIFDQSDNPQDDVQAENRAHRLGQIRDVEVIRLITRGTIEELVYKACQNKLKLAERVTGWLEEDAEKSAKDIEKEVLRMLQNREKGTPMSSDDSKA